MCESVCAYTLCQISRNLDAGGGEIVYIYVATAKHKTPFVFLIAETLEPSVGSGTAFAAHCVLPHAVPLWGFSREREVG